MDELELFTFNFFLFFMMTFIIFYMLFYMPYTQWKIIDSFKERKSMENMEDILSGNYN